MPKAFRHQTTICGIGGRAIVTSSYYKVIAMETDVLHAAEVKREVHRGTMKEVAEYLKDIHEEGMIWLILPQ